jgi:hypothetical protein
MLIPHVSAIDGHEPAVVRILVTSLLESVINGIGGPSSQIALDSQRLSQRDNILKVVLDTKDSQKDGELQPAVHKVHISL